jgi:glucokinase
MKYDKDDRIVMTLDAGGTNFVFSAIQNNKEIVDPVTLPSNGDDLNKCLNNIIEGFSQVKAKLEKIPSAISFAFPGPVEYTLGVIGDLTNLPAFRGGIALGPMLEEKFKLPVFINNDGDLFAYGEAIAGFLPHVNNLLKEAGSPKRYNNLLGITLGTGFGAGIVRNNELYIGDNSCGGEIWLLRNKLNPKTNAEEGASIRAVQRAYSKLAGIPFDNSLSPKDIYEIGLGKKDGNKNAALEAYRQLGESVGDSLSQAITLLDGLIVLGGGIAAASDLFMPALIDEMNGTYESPTGVKFPRLALKTYNIEDKNQLNQFLQGNKTEITVPFSERKMLYDPQKRIGIGISRLGTSKAVAIGAFAYALQKLDKMK